jgi:hypothetical protein
VECVQKHNRCIGAQLCKNQVKGRRGKKKLRSEEALAGFTVA